MESLGDTLWDVVICGTGLQQSLLALALSRSGKKILHLDPNDFYGGAEAALTLQEATAWVERLDKSGSRSSSVFRSASITKSEDSPALSFSRAYSLALAPQLIHSRSQLLNDLVSSRAYKQVEFLAVGSFFIFQPPSEASEKPTLNRIPSTREDVFLTTSIPAKAKRGLMKFLKFVLDYDVEPKRESWQPYTDMPLSEFLSKEFKMDTQLQTYIITLTLSLDGNLSTKDGLAVIHRHLSSMGVFGPGFAAIYPKWGGISEIAQVSCRAGAVGGAVYMLGTGIESIDTTVADQIQLQLTSGDTVKTRMLVKSSEVAVEESGVSRLIVIIGSPLKMLFEAVVEGQQKPAVAVVALPSGSLTYTAGKTSPFPVYVFAHSSDTGECPVGQSMLYLTTMTTPDAEDVLGKALQSFLDAVGVQPSPDILYQLYYERMAGTVDGQMEGSILSFPAASPSLAFDDLTLGPVREAWKRVLGDAADESAYMTFADREGIADDDDDLYD
ncbi:GDP dissociation inhibitor-domain-containing protein [Podospora didyma]|uniref:Rab proteins geranylgeranyltransferase n=1 Tax=Podospora didyma TaxID=330526 RepID=A0AAE0U6X6_9PEZI|nr:GDP dissociation inhibitor-domain-containing protein [Podospora didyma]